MHWSALLGYFVSFPVLALAASVGATFRTAVPRLLLLSVGLEFGAQVAHSFQRPWRLDYLDDISGFTVAFAGGALVVAIPLGRLRPKFHALAGRWRRAPEPTDHDAPPRRPA